MRSYLILVFVIGLANAAISDKLPNKDWDDEDSMILPSTTSKGFSSLSRVPSEEKPAPLVLDDRTHYISLIPTSEQHDDNSQEPDAKKRTSNPEEFSPELPQNPQEHEQLKPEEPATTQEDSGEDSGSVSSEYTTEGSKIRIVQLGKIPLTYEIIPLMSNDENTYEKSPVKPVSFFPEQSGDMMIAKAKVLRREQEQQQRGETEEEQAEEYTAQVQTTTDDLPHEPLTYLTPPRQDGENYWRQYPLAPGHDLEGTNMADNHQASASEADYQEPMTTLNPILERLNAFLQKAKRHSEERQFQQQEHTPVEETKDDEHIESAGESREISSSPFPDAEETTNTSQPSTDETSENSEDQSSSMTTDSTPLPTLSTELLPPKLGIPEREPYLQSRVQPSPYWTNGPVSPSVDQYFSDYIQQNLPINKYYYSNPELQIQTSMKPPRALYPSVDSYLPRRYLPFEKAVSSDNIDYPFIRYNDYYRPSRSNLIARPTSLINSVNDEERYLGGLGYSNELGYGYGNGNPSSYNFGSTPFNSYYPRPYSTNNYRPIVPYQPYRSSSNLVNNLMYAPLYSYQQYRQFQPQQEYI